MRRILCMSIILLFATQVFAQTRDYNDLHNKLIKFYGYQRSGLASGSCYNLNSGFSNAAYGGDSYNGNPLDGGWYDAGDYVKFGMNLSYSVYCLLKGYDVFPTAYADNYSWSYGAADQIPDILNEVKFATDYIMKAVIDANTVVLDVGNANSEHGSWSVPSGGGRSGGQIYPCTGADIPATYAACLACMSTLYRKYDAAYADKCLAKAKAAFTFATTKIGNNNLYCQPQGTFYDYTKNDKGVYQRQINDRMVAAGVELYRASNAAKVTPDPLYKTWALKNIADMYNCIGYAFIGPLASFEVWRQGLASAPSSLLSNVSFIETRIMTTGTFANVYQNSGWGTARDVGTAAFEYALAYVATADDAIRTAYKNRATTHVDWVAGYVGARSYICGVNGGPSSIHYRTTNYGAVPGAVVAGPGSDGSWPNPTGADYQRTEVAIDYNAGLVGAVAFLKTGSGGGIVSQSFSASSKTVDLTSGNVVLKAGFSSSVNWTVKIIGSAGSKTYTGSGTTINQAWDGSADDGYFVGGESVIASISIDKDISAMDILKVQPIQIMVSKTKPITTTAKDILIDNFTDNNVSNDFGGKWEAIGSGKGLSATTASATGGTLLVSGSVGSNSHSIFAGVMTSFNASGTSVNLSPVTSVVCDLKSTKPVNVSVELVQSNIKDSAYWSADVPVTSTQNSYRIKISQFKQPDWKTSSVNLDLSQITSLRFTVYDSTGLISFYVDNFYLENYATDVVFANKHFSSSFAKPVISNGSLIYRIPQSASGEREFAIYNVAGKTVMKKAFSAKAGEVVSVPISELPAGMYTLVNSTNGILKGERIRFVRTR